MTSITEPKLARHIADMTPDERNYAVASAMRLRNRFIRPTATIGRTKLYLAQCDPTSAGEVAQSVARFYNDFPHVAAKLDRVDVVDLPQGAYACTSDQHTGSYDISLSTRAYGPNSRRFLIDRAQEDWEKGYHGFSDPSGAFEHELGHVLDMGTGYVGSGSLMRWDAAQISGYAHAGPEEAFAEAFANWRYGVRSGAHAEAVLGHVIRQANAPRRAAA